MEKLPGDDILRVVKTSRVPNTTNTTYTLNPSDFYAVYPPFNLQNRTFEELPESKQRYLINTNLYPRQFPDTQAFFDALLEVRTARRDRFERTLEGVSRAIAREMLESHSRTGNGAMDERCKAELRDVLQPEWRDHLDSYVEEIDSLIWLDMTARNGSLSQPTFEQYMVERKDDIERMVEFALHCLQRALEKVRLERKAQWLLSEMLYEGDGRIEDAYSDSSDPETDDGQWVAVSTSN